MAEEEEEEEKKEAICGSRQCGRMQLINTRSASIHKADRHHTATHQTQTPTFVTIQHTNSTQHTAYTPHTAHSTPAKSSCGSFPGHTGAAGDGHSKHSKPSPAAVRRRSRAALEDGRTRATEQGSVHHTHTYVHTSCSRIPCPSPTRPQVTRPPLRAYLLTNNRTDNRTITQT
jgi:hypothetical protein